MSTKNGAYSRRNFMKIFAAAAATSTVLSGCKKEKPMSEPKYSGDKPNILVIVTDHTAQKSLPSYGDKYADVPSIEGIIKKGVRFSNVYTPCPLCQPARTAFWTGLYPHQTGVVDNLPTEPDPNFTRLSPMMNDGITTLGDVFSAAGYIARHFGKTHDAGALRGFVCDDPAGELPVEGTDAWPVNMDTTRDRYTTVRCAEFLEQKHNKPFIAIADLNNPHNICGWVGANKGEHIDKPIEGVLPELPDNFETEDMETRPAGIRYLCCTHPRLTQASVWNGENYRHYLAAYYHYLKRADDDIAIILNALKKNGYDKNTLVVFMADHGDGLASHRMVTKRLSFYEETTRVPLVFAGHGVDGADKLIEQPLVSTLDLVPTLCDYAGLEIPQGIEGKSLMYYLNGKGSPVERDYIVSQWDAEWNFTREPGRMLRTKQYKYIKYVENSDEELYDIQNDPGEKKNLAPNTDYKEVLERHRVMFTQYLKATNDPFETLPAIVDPRWRTHTPGYTNHTGGCAKDFPPPKELM